MTAEYSLLPASTGERTGREARSGRQQGRTVEIQRLIGRALRAVCRLRGARRAHALARLRRPSGRRRHPLRVDLRRVRCRAARARPFRPVEGVHGLGCCRLRRHRRRRGAARPRLLGGLDCGRRPQRRDDRRRPPRRGAGHRRARSVQPRPARRAPLLAEAGIERIREEQAEAADATRS